MRSGYSKEQDDRHSLRLKRVAKIFKDFNIQEWSAYAKCYNDEELFRNDQSIQVYSFLSTIC